MALQDCIFCKIATGQIPCHKIYENDSVLAFLDIGPLSEGHTLVIPKAHFEKLDQCPPEILSGVIQVVGNVSRAIVSALGCDGYNVLCNNGMAAGQEVHHIHFHVIPRTSGDDVFTEWKSGSCSKDQAELLANRITQNL